MTDEQWRKRMSECEQLRKYAKDHDMSHAQLAERLGLARETVTRVINGQQPITERIIGRFFVAFGSEDTQAVFGDRVDLPAVAEVAEAVEEA
jgi:plasmid maintenance system antidote protein VapI